MVISIIALLIAILLPVLGNARDSANDMNCKSNLHQLGIAQFAYAGDNKGQFTMARRWVWTNNGSYSDPTNINTVRDGELFPYVNDSTEIYLCPIAQKVLDTTPWGGRPMVRNYVQNWNIGPRRQGDFESDETSLDSAQRPSELVILTEENTYRITGFSNYTMNDGYLLGRFSTGDSRPVDSFASFHNAADGNAKPEDGYAYAVFADGAVTEVDYKGDNTGHFPWKDPATGITQQISRTIMWCSDDIPNQN